MAGIFDADGTVSSINNRYNDTKIAITSKHKEFLTLIQELIGGKVSTMGRGREMYQLALRKLERLYIVPQLIPYALLKRARLLVAFENDINRRRVERI